MERNGALGRGAKRTRSAPRRRRSRHSRARRSPATRESCRGGGSREPRAPSRRGKRTSRDKHLTRAKEEPRFSNSNSNASFPTANSQEKSSEDFDGNLRREKAEGIRSVWVIRNHGDRTLREEPMCTKSSTARAEPGFGEAGSRISVENPIPAVPMKNVPDRIEDHPQRNTISKL